MFSLPWLHREEVALNVLKTKGPGCEPYARFRHEIEVVRNFTEDQVLRGCFPARETETRRRASVRAL